MAGTVMVWLCAFFLLIALLVLVIYQASMFEALKDLWMDLRVLSFAIYYVDKKNEKFLLYWLMSLMDLEFDYINPYDSSSRINKVILPEFMLQGILCLLFLVSGQWVMMFLSAPMLYYNVKLYQQQKHLIDVTEIFNQLNWEKKHRLIKLCYLVILLFLSLFWMVFSVLEDD